MPCSASHIFSDLLEAEDGMLGVEIEKNEAIKLCRYENIMIYENGDGDILIKKTNRINGHCN